MYTEVPEGPTLYIYVCMCVCVTIVKNFLQFREMHFLKKKSTNKTKRNETAETISIKMRINGL